MARIFLSFLGTNDYLPCTYHRGDFQSANVRFVQEATIGLCCGGWGPEDRVLIFTTPEAFRKNWCNDGHINPKTKARIPRKGLGECLSEAGISCRVMKVAIPDGKSEAEIWEIFNIVYGALEERDDIVFDITHALRSIPMLAIAILNYAKVMKRVTLSGIYYGAFEVLGNIHAVGKMPASERKVPIFDLTAFDQLMDWSVAIDRFLESGDGALINSLTRGGLKKILTETNGRDADAVAIRNIGSTLASFCDTMATCREKEIAPVSKKLKSQMAQCENTGLLPPFQPLFQRLRERIAPFGGDRLTDGICAATWCVTHNLVQQGATILREVVISYLVSQKGADIVDPGERAWAAKAISTALSRITGKTAAEEKHKDPGEEFSAYMRLCDRQPNLAKIWGQLAPLRNDLNHAGFVQAPKRATAFSKQLPALIQKVEREIVSVHK